MNVAVPFAVHVPPGHQGLEGQGDRSAGEQPVGDPTQCHAVAVDARAPKFDGGIVTRLDCIPFGIVVN